MDFTYPVLNETYKATESGDLPLEHTNAYGKHLEKFYAPACEINVKQHKCPQITIVNPLEDASEYNSTRHWAVQEEGPINFSYGTEGDVSKMYGYEKSLKETEITHSKKSNKVVNKDIEENFNLAIKQSYADPKEQATDYLISQKTTVNSSSF